MKRKLILLLLLTTVLVESKAQFTRYLIKLKNKGGTPYTIAAPTAYLSQRAVDRRTKYSISIDSTDLPVTPSYITQIKAVPNVTVLNVSKWLNSISILTTDPAAITTINALPFVQSVSGLAAKIANVSGKNKFKDEESISTLSPQRVTKVESDFYNYGGSAFNEIHLHNGEFLHNIGLRGQGMQIAMLDGGFFNYTTLKAFDSVNLNGQVLGTWDFVNREASVIEDNSHGMMCFSTIAANIPGQFVGKAPKASFYLFRTEDVATEYLIEEHNWVCGAERADSAGVDVISSSLGYTTFDLPGSDHPYSDRNGNVAMITIGADLAAKKGLIVFNAVGNIGDASTQFLSVPADGDSVVAVGSVNTSGAVANSSSFGPSSDGQIKPDVASVGVNAVVQATNNTIGTSSGTSFACPNMAGLGTCLWQGFPEFNNMKIVRALQRAGNIFSSPNDRIGYGIPNMKLAFSNLLIDYATSTASINACNVTINWSSKDIGAMKYEIERKTSAEQVFTKIGEINSTAGILLANHSYQFSNSLSNVPNGPVSYRIRQIIDTDAATFTGVYIDTATVTSSGCTDPGNPNPVLPDLITLTPNPISSNATLLVRTSYAIPDLYISVYDMKGSLLLQMKQTKAIGQASFNLPVSHFSKGKYVVRVFNAQKRIGTIEMLKL